MKITKFEDLKIWQDALSITKEIYDISSAGKFGKDFSLRDQLRRSVISISSNIVEGFEKNNNNEFIRFLRIAKGSAGESRSQLHIALVVGYISSDQFSVLIARLEKISNQIGAFISYLEKMRSRKEFIQKSVKNNPLTR